MARKLSVKDSLELKNFEAWIEVDGEKLACYAIDIPTKRARDASCWVASEEDKTFCVKLCRTQPAKCHCRVTLSLDGTVVDHQIVRKTDHYATFHGLETKDGSRPFQFAPLNVTDEDEYRDILTLRPEAQKIGEITLKVHRVTFGSTNQRKGDTSNEEDNSEIENSDEESIPEPQKVHESSLKATIVPHQISFGHLDPSGKRSLPSESGAGEVPKGTYYKKEWYDKKECLSTFTFRYRPLDVLIDGGIVPRRLLTSNEESGEGESDDEDLDTDDREFYGSPPPTYMDPTVPLRASSRFASIAPDGHPKRVNYADPDSAEEDEDSDIYVRTEDELAKPDDHSETTQAQAETQAHISPKPQASPIDTHEDLDQPEDLLAPTVFIEPLFNSIITHTDGAPHEQAPPIIRQESVEPALHSDVPAVDATGQCPLVVNQEDCKMKIEEIEEKASPESEDDAEDEEERDLRLQLESLRERKRKTRALQRAAAKKVKIEAETRVYFTPGEVIDLVST